MACIAYVFIAFAPALGVEHNLLVYGSDPGWTYSDMRGFEPFIGPWLWFKLYWAAWALLLAVAAKLFWVRGKERASARGSRWRAAASRARAAGVARRRVALVLTLGRLHLLQHERPERVPHALPTAASGAPSTSGATGGTRAFRSRS